MSTRVFQYLGRGKGFGPYRPRLKVSDDDIEAMRMLYPGSTGRPKIGSPGGGLRTIAKLLGCSHRTVSLRLMKIAEREEL